jgi:hypothetical protein
MISNPNQSELCGEAKSGGNPIRSVGRQNDDRANDNQASLARTPEQCGKFPILRVGSVSRKFRDMLRAAIPEAVRARLRPYRKPDISQEQWEQEYRDGCWSHLHKARELVRRSI